MTTGTLDKRLVTLLAVSAAVALVLRFGVYGDNSSPTVVAASETAPQAEQRLDQLRRISATLDGKEAVKKQAEAELAVREKGLIQADTEAQARAQLLELTTNIARSNGIDTHGMDDYKSRAVSSDYGEISVTVSFTCAIEQLVNFLAALANQPQILATNEIRVSGGHDKKKNVQVRVSVSGVVPRKLLPAEKKGLAAF
jgi:Tfp pilus assembly protein PilO